MHKILVCFSFLCWDILCVIRALDILIPFFSTGVKTHHRISSLMIITSCLLQCYMERNHFVIRYFCFIRWYSLSSKDQNVENENSSKLSLCFYNYVDWVLKTSLSTALNKVLFRLTSEASLVALYSSQKATKFQLTAQNRFF